MPRGRHRPTKTDPAPLVDTWEAWRVRYTKPAWWARWIRA